MVKKLILFIDAISIKQCNYSYAKIYAHRKPHPKKPWLSHFTTIDPLGTVRYFYPENDKDPIIITIVTEYSHNSKKNREKLSNYEIALIIGGLRV